MSVPNPNPSESWTIVSRRRSAKNSKKNPYGNPNSAQSQALTLKPSSCPWTPLDSETDPNRQSKLLQRMHLCITKLQSSKFYSRFLSRLQEPQIQDQFTRILSFEPHFQLVVYGIGSIESFETPRLQLSLAFLLWKQLGPKIGSIEVFDPILSSTECAVMEELGFSVIRVDEEARREVKIPTLFFMPHCEVRLYDNLLDANWRPEMLNKTVVLGNSFGEYERYVGEVVRGGGGSVRVGMEGRKVIGVRGFVREVGMEGERVGGEREEEGDETGREDGAQADLYEKCERPNSYTVTLLHTIHSPYSLTNRLRFSRLRPPLKPYSIRSTASVVPPLRIQRPDLLPTRSDPSRRNFAPRLRLGFGAGSPSLSLSLLPFPSLRTRLPLSLSLSLSLSSRSPKTFPLSPSFFYLFPFPPQPFYLSLSNKREPSPTFHRTTRTRPRPRRLLRRPTFPFLFNPLLLLGFPRTAAEFDPKKDSIAAPSRLFRSGFFYFRSRNLWPFSRLSMAIVKNSIRVSRLDGDFSPGSRGTLSTEESDDDDELRARSSASSDSDDGSDPSDVDSGMGSDEFDLSELGEPNTEFCQVGTQSFSVPLELYDLPDLSSILSLETWNNCLSEEERFALAEHLPDLDQENFSLTLRELFAGENLYFGSPLAELFNLLKGGLLDPRVALYRRGLSFFQKRRHYHSLRKYQNSMVWSIVQIKDAWQNCSGYGIEERLRLLNILRSQRSLGYERGGDLGSETDSESANSAEGLWSQRFKMDRRAIASTDPRFGKENAKGILKVTPPKASKEEYMGVLGGRFPLSVKHGLEKKVKGLKSVTGFPQQDQVERFDLASNRRVRDRMRDEDDFDASDSDNDDDALEDRRYGMGSRAGLLKPGKRKELMKRYARDVESRFGDEDNEGYGGLPQYQSKSRNADQGVTIASYDPHSFETMSKAKYSEKDWPYPPKNRPQHQVLKGPQVDWSTGSQPLRRGKMHEDDMSPDYPVKFDEWNGRGKKWKGEDDLRTSISKIRFDSKVRPSQAYPAQMGDPYLHSDYRAKTLQGKFKRNSARSGGVGMEYSRGSIMFARSEETESDSSEEAEEDGDVNPYANKLGYPSDGMEGHHQLGVLKPAHDPKMSGKLGKVDKKLYSSIQTPDMETYSMKGKQKSKTSEPNYMHDIKSVKKAQVARPCEKSQRPSLKSYPVDKKRKAMIDLEQSNYMHDYRSGILDEHEEYVEKSSRFLDGQTQYNKAGNRYRVIDAVTTESDHYERPNMSLLGCNSVTKKRKGKADVTNRDETEESVYLQSSPMKQVDEPNFIKKKGKKKSDAGAGSLSMATPDAVIPEKGAADAEPEAKQPKKPFTLITPSKHTGFSFSIIHLLSAVRKAMITPQTEDAADIGNHLEKGDGRLKPKIEESKRPQAINGTCLSQSHVNMDVNSSERAAQNNSPSLTVQELVNRVRSNPGDPCILETQEPLQDLVRGVLKIFSSKTAPLGAKGWKALVSYEKSNKSWSWVGPVSSSLSDNDTVEEETSSEAWGVPHKMLVKLVDAFANWLKSGQETLQQIGSLPAPPIALLPQLDEKERFRDLRAQKSLNTINPSSEEVRAYFRREELLRYSIPDRAFSYTAADGKKSIVAPLRRGGGKPTSKARDHFMLKPDRPPHVTILCLVRDAAARLPGSIGTRADVCTLIRDSQYIVEDVSDAQVNQVVSGALDRLHYERDPCVQFDGDRKLWVYLHRDREEEDFEDDGTSSTKKWKRQRKDVADQPDSGAANDVSYPTTVDPTGSGPAKYDLNPDLNVDSSSIHAGMKSEPLYSDLKSNMSYVNQTSGDREQGNPVGWETLGLNPLRENKMLCQENSTNEDFDDETFSRERPVGLLSASSS